MADDSTTAGIGADNQTNKLDWFEVGPVQGLKDRACRRLYTKSKKDLALFCVDDGKKFFASKADCPHAKGPLDQGDIEDLGSGKYTITCPLHMYCFDLKDGSSETGLKLVTYETEVRDGTLFVKAPEKVSLTSKGARDL